VRWLTYEGEDPDSIDTALLRRQRNVVLNYRSRMISEHSSPDLLRYYLSVMPLIGAVE